jgi:hypothetical protein
MTGNKISDADIGKGAVQQTDTPGSGNEISRASVGGSVSQTVGTKPGLSIWGYRATGVTAISAIVIIALAYYLLR